MVLSSFSLHEEQKPYETELHMDNPKILQTATINPARYFGLDDLGLVEEGFIADLVVLDKNRLEEIENI